MQDFLEEVGDMWCDFKTSLGYTPLKMKIYLVLAGTLKVVVLIAIINFGASISRLFLPMERTLLIVICFGWWLNNYFINEFKDWSKNRR